MSIKRLRPLLLIALLFSFPAVSGAADDFASSALGQQLVNLGLKFLDNPGDFFFNLHADNEDYSPLPSGSHGAVRFNFFPTFLPTTWGNINVKVNVLGEKGKLPQIDAVGMYGDLLALRMLGGTDITSSFSDYSAGVVASKSTDKKTRLFGGVKYSAVNMEVAFSSPVAFGAFEMAQIDFQVADTFIFSGINHEYRAENFVVAQIGYGFKYKKIVSRVMVSHRHLELGMDIYPEGLFVIHPFMAWHWYF